MAIFYIIIFTQDFKKIIGHVVQLICTKIWRHNDALLYQHDRHKQLLHLA